MISLPGYDRWKTAEPVLNDEADHICKYCNHIFSVTQPEFRLLWVGNNCHTWSCPDCGTVNFSWFLSNGEVRTQHD